jgi:adenine-specific DNA-methyltransferase
LDVAMTKINSKIVTEIIDFLLSRYIIFDRFFVGNDELKTNTALQMRDAGVEFRVV